MRNLYKMFTGTLSVFCLLFFAASCSKDTEAKDYAELEISRYRGGFPLKSNDGNTELYIISSYAELEKLVHFPEDHAGFDFKRHSLLYTPKHGQAGGYDNSYSFRHHKDGCYTLVIKMNKKGGVTTQEWIPLAFKVPALPKGAKVKIEAQVKG